MSSGITIWECEKCGAYSDLPGRCIQCKKALIPYTYIRAEVLAAKDARIAELAAALNDCRNFADDAMGEWSGIQPPRLPANLEGYFDIVGTVDDVLKDG